jgi:hypothetical protein
LGGDLVLLLLGTVACYGVAFFALSRVTPGKAHLYAALIVGLALVAYWLTLDHALHTTNRYYLRTALALLTPMIGTAAAICALRADGRLNLSIPIAGRAAEVFAMPAMGRAIIGVFLLVMLVHAVETAKFVKAWTDYKAAVASLATGQVSDPALGDAEFVSSDRIGADLNHLSWFSTTQFLSVIVAKFTPTRLVVDPTDSYFWFSCETAKANTKAKRAVPPATRRLVRVHACLHR